MPLDINIARPIGADIAAPRGLGAAAQPAAIATRIQSINARREAAALKEGNQIVENQLAQAKLKYLQDTVNGVDNPQEYLTMSALASKYYEETGQLEKSALIEQRAFLAQERYLNKLDRAANGGGSGGSGGSGSTAGIATTIDQTQFMAGYDSINEQISNLKKNKEMGMIEDPREYAAALTSLYKMKEQFVNDYVRDEEDKSSLLGSDNFWSAKDISMNKKGRLFLANPSPLEAATLENDKAEFQDLAKITQNPNADLVYIQDTREDGSKFFKVATKDKLQELSDKDVYFTMPKYGQAMVYNDQTQKMESVDSVTSGDYYYKADLKEDDQGNVIGLKIQDYQSGDERWIKLSDSAAPILDAYNAGEIDKSDVLKALANPRIAQNKYAVSDTNFISDPFAYSNWLEGSQRADETGTGRFFNEPPDHLQMRMVKDAENQNFSQEGALLMSSPDLIPRREQAEEQNMSETPQSVADRLGLKMSIAPETTIEQVKRDAMQQTTPDVLLGSQATPTPQPLTVQVPQLPSLAKFYQGIQSGPAAQVNRATQTKPQPISQGSNPIGGFVKLAINAARTGREGFQSIINNFRRT